VPDMGTADLRTAGQKIPEAAAEVPNRKPTQRKHTVTHTQHRTRQPTAFPEPLEAAPVQPGPSIRSP